MHLPTPVAALAAAFLVVAPTTHAQTGGGCDPGVYVNSGSAASLGSRVDAGGGFLVTGEIAPLGIGHIALLTESGGQVQEVQSIQGAAGVDPLKFGRLFAFDGETLIAQKSAQALEVWELVGGLLVHAQDVQLGKTINDLDWHIDVEGDAAAVVVWSDGNPLGVKEVIPLFRDGGGTWSVAASIPAGTGQYFPVRMTPQRLYVPLYPGIQSYVRSAPTTWTADEVLPLTPVASSGFGGRFVVDDDDAAVALPDVGTPPRWRASTKGGDGTWTSQLIFTEIYGSASNFPFGSLDGGVLTVVGQKYNAPSTFHNLAQWEADALGNWTELGRISTLSAATGFKGFAVAGDDNWMWVTDFTYQGGDGAAARFWSPLFEDCNQNGEADGCELALLGSAVDCNANGVLDECDILFGTSQDANANDLPDECEPYVFDCNGNLVDDAQDIALGTSVDCNSNGIPDECEFPDGTPTDCATPTIAILELLDANGLPLDPAAILTDVAAPGMPAGPHLQLTGWGFPATLAGNEELFVTFRGHYHDVSVSTLPLDNGTRLDVPLPAFPPGPGLESTLEIDVVVELATDNGGVITRETIVSEPAAFDYTVYEIDVPPGSGAAIQAAIAAARPGTRIRLQPFSSYTSVSLAIADRDRLSLIGDLQDPSSVELRGVGGQPVVAILGAGSDSTLNLGGFQARDGATGLSVSAGAAPWVASALFEGNISISGQAGGVDVSGGAAPLLSDVRVNANYSSGSGGGIRVDGATLELYDSLVVGNEAAIEGGGLSVRNTTTPGRVRVFNTSFLCNFAQLGHGGGIHLGFDARARIFGCAIETNFARSGGAGIAIEDALDVSVAGNSILFNNDPASASGCGSTWTATGHTEGGGIFVAADTLPSIDGNVIRGNRASVGGAVFIENFANPRLTRNWIACNVAAPSLSDGLIDYYGPGVYIEGTTLGDSAQPDLLNNTIVDNRVVDGSAIPPTARGFGIDGGLLGLGAPQLTNNVLAEHPQVDCPVPVTMPQGFALHFDNNQFAEIRANTLFGGLELTSGVDCDGNPGTPGDTLCTTCCPISGFVVANQYADPVVNGDVVAEVAPGSPAYLAGLPADSKLPPDLYNGIIPVSQGYVERDGILATGAFVGLPVETAREAGSDAAVFLPSGTTVSLAVQLDVQDQILTPSDLEVPGLVGTYGLTAEFRSQFGQPTGAPNVLGLELPLRPPLNQARELALFQRDAATGTYFDTGWRSEGIDPNARTARFVEVLTNSSPGDPADPALTEIDLSEPLVGVVLLPDLSTPGCGVELYGLGASPTVNTISLDGGSGTGVGDLFEAISTEVAGFGPVITALTFGEALLPLFGGTLLVNPVGFQAVTAVPVTDPMTGQLIFTSTFPIPNQPSLASLVVYFQSFGFNPQYPGGWELSNGMKLTICP